MFIPYISKESGIDYNKELRTLNTTLLSLILISNNKAKPKPWRVIGLLTDDGWYILGEFNEKSEAESFFNSLINTINKIG
jgi:hypothetical protein